MADIDDICTQCCEGDGGAPSESTFMRNVQTLLCQLVNSGGGELATDVNVTAIGGSAVSLGQKVMASSIPIVIASNQSSIPVAVASVVPGTAATNLGKAEDTAHTTGDVGVFVLGVKELTPTNSAAAGDYIAFKGNIVGATYVEPANQVAVPAEGTLAFGAVSAAAYATLITNSAKAVIISILNRLDRDIVVSFDALTAAAIVPINESRDLALGASGRWMASDLSVKSLASDPTAGSVYATIIS